MSARGGRARRIKIFCELRRQSNRSTIDFAIAFIAAIQKQ
jgi:hypothetical protein